MTTHEAALLRVYVNASDRWKGGPLYEALVAAARAQGLAGASVFPVSFGFGEHRRIHDAASEYQFAEEPVVIEVVDEPGKVDALLVAIGPMLKGGLVTVETVRVVRPDDLASGD